MCNYYVGADRVQLSWHFVVELVKYRFPDQLTAYLLSWIDKADWQAKLSMCHSTTGLTAGLTDGKFEYCSKTSILEVLAKFWANTYQFELTACSQSDRLLLSNISNSLTSSILWRIDANKHFWSKRVAVLASLQELCPTQVRCPCHMVRLLSYDKCTFCPQIPHILVPAWHLSMYPLWYAHISTNVPQRLSLSFEWHINCMLIWGCCTTHLPALAWACMDSIVAWVRHFLILGAAPQPGCAHPAVQPITKP